MHGLEYSSTGLLRLYRVISLCRCNQAGTVRIAKSAKAPPILSDEFKPSCPARVRNALAFRPALTRRPPDTGSFYAPDFQPVSRGQSNIHFFIIIRSNTNQRVKSKPFKDDQDNSLAISSSGRKVKWITGSESRMGSDDCHQSAWRKA